MYGITENIYYSQLFFDALLLQPEPNCCTSYNTKKGLGSLSLCAVVLRSSPPSHVSTCNGQRSSQLWRNSTGALESDLWHFTLENVAYLISQMEVTFPCHGSVFLSSAPDRDEWPASRFGRFIMVGVRWVGCWARTAAATLSQQKATECDWLLALKRALSHHVNWRLLWRTTGPQQCALSSVGAPTSTRDTCSECAAPRDDKQLCESADVFPFSIYKGQKQSPACEPYTADEGDFLCYSINTFERIMFLDFVHRPVFYLKHNVSETGSVSVFRLK
jgi:hypothetical protein